ncbi:domain protein [Seminavis robusta]|uniref:Domain protein n=1 Tax=Seminavis robusta TaxID=568900 RepID=A0A9N8DLF3_9STRA|nr:domain protein [Seminavis robusta]|eukprot:Sro146_g067570.1 domain protein (322) ;mRNA; f:54768-55733
MYVSPIICGEDQTCEYSNACYGLAAGFEGCTPVEPAPTPRPSLANNGGGNTVLQQIQSNPELSGFAVALELSGLDSLLNENDKEFTVFAPSNQAIANDPVFSTYATMDGWIHHLRTNVQLMIVQNQVLTDADIFDAATTELVSLNGTLQISQPFAQVNLVSMERPNQAGSNGVVHTMDGVIKNYWREYTLRDVNQHDELVDGLSPILDRIQFDEPLMEFEPSGTSWIAARNRGYGNDSIALGFYPIVQELKDPNNAEFQNLTYMYNLIDFNLYEQDIERGFQLLVMPRAGVAHMWITKDMTKGLLRFNDAVLDRQAFASNG